MDFIETTRVDDVNSERPIKIEMRPVRFLGKGGDGKVNLVEITLLNQQINGKSRELPGTFVHKEMRNKGEMAEYARIYQHLRDRHDDRIKLPNMFRLVEDGFLMTDLSNNGANLVISANDIPSEPQSKKAFREQVTNKYRELIPFITRDLIKTLAQETCEGLSDAEVLSARDSFMLMVTPGGEVTIFIADYGYMQIVQGDNDYHRDSQIKAIDPYDDPLYYYIDHRNAGAMDQFVTAILDFLKN